MLNISEDFIGRRINKMSFKQLTMGVTQRRALLISLAVTGANICANEHIYASDIARDGNLYTTPFYYTWKHPQNMYAKNGTGVNGAAVTGGYITGIPGFIIGVPVGVVGAFFGQVTNNDKDMGFQYALNTTSNLFCRFGQHVLGLPALGVKKSIDAARANDKAPPEDKKAGISRPIR